MLVVHHNMQALNANRQYKRSVIASSKSAEKLSSGYRINRAADDAAGLEISSKLNKQIKGIDQGLMNAQEGISLCQVADGELNEASNMLQRMNELALQAANGTNSDSDRQAIQSEIDQLKSEINRIGETTTFNEQKVFKNPDAEAKGFMSVGSLVNSPSVKAGLMVEAFHYTNTAKPGLIGYYPAGTLDFSNVDVSNVQYLYDKSFSFHCSVGCKEAFKFTMIDGDGTQSSVKNFGRYDTHEYTIDIHGLTNGKEVVDKIYKYIEENPIYNRPGGQTMDKKFPDGILVSHSNTIFKTGDGILTISSHTRKNNNENGKTEAEEHFPNSTSRPHNMGEIECTIMGAKGEVARGENTYNIQAGADGDNKVEVSIDYMNTSTLEIDDVNVGSEAFATYSLNLIEKALNKIMVTRSRIGAQQNRLEHAVRTLGNTSENTTASYSQIKDTDMASEMVKYSNSNILNQAGESVLAQANQFNQGVLALLE